MKRSLIFSLAFIAFTLILSSNALKYNNREGTAPEKLKQKDPNPQFIAQSHNKFPLLSSRAISNNKNYKFQIEDFTYNGLSEGKKHLYFQTNQAIFMMKSTNSSEELITTNFAEISIPEIILNEQECTHIVVDPHEIYSISTCKDLSDNSTYLVMMSYLTARPFYAVSMKTNLTDSVQIKLSDQFLLVLDQDAHTKSNSRVHVYGINLGAAKFGKQPIELIAQIDQNDFNVSSMNITYFEIFAKAEENSNSTSSLYAIHLLDQAYGYRRIILNPETRLLANATSSAFFPKKNEQEGIVAVGALAQEDSGFFSNTTFRSWFWTFLVILGLLAIMAFCAEKTAEHRETLTIVDRSALQNPSEFKESGVTYKVIPSEN